MHKIKWYNFKWLKVEGYSFEIKIKNLSIRNKTSLSLSVIIVMFSHFSAQLVSCQSMLPPQANKHSHAHQPEQHTDLREL